MLKGVVGGYVGMGGLWRGINGVAQRLPGDNEKRGRVMGGGKNNQELMDYFPFYPLFFIINLLFFRRSWIFDWKLMCTELDSC